MTPNSLRRDDVGLTATFSFFLRRRGTGRRTLQVANSPLMPQRFLMRRCSAIFRKDFSEARIDTQSATTHWDMRGALGAGAIANLSSRSGARGRTYSLKRLRS